MSKKNIKALALIQSFKEITLIIAINPKMLLIRGFLKFSAAPKYLKITKRVFYT